MAAGIALHCEQMGECIDFLIVHRQGLLPMHHALVYFSQIGEV